MPANVLVLVVVLVVATGAGVGLRRYNGHFRGAAKRSAAAPLTGAVAAAEVLSADDLQTDLGERATLVQFSSAFCAPCRVTRRVLADVAAMVPGVAHVEIDAEHRLDLVRRLGVMRTPTTFVLDAGGTVVTRASGAPRPVDVIAAVGRATEWRYHQMRLLSRQMGRSGSAVGPSRTLNAMESTFLTKRRAVDNCHTATALCRMP